VGEIASPNPYAAPLGAVKLDLVGAMASLLVHGSRVSDIDRPL